MTQAIAVVAAVAMTFIAAPQLTLPATAQDGTQFETIYKNQPEFQQKWCYKLTFLDNHNAPSLPIPHIWPESASPDKRQCYTFDGFYQHYLNMCGLLFSRLADPASSDDQKGLFTLVCADARLAYYAVRGEIRSRVTPRFGGKEPEWMRH